MKTGRFRRIVRSTHPWGGHVLHLGRSLDLLIRALLQCWGVLLTGAVLPAILLRTGQGMEALLASMSDNSSLFVLIAWVYFAVLSYFVSLWILQRWQPAERGRPLWFARYCAPTVVMIAVGLLVPFSIGVGQPLTVAETETLTGLGIYLLLLFGGLVIGVRMWIYVDDGESTTTQVLNYGAIGVVGVVAWFVWAGSKPGAVAWCLIGAVVLSDWAAVRFSHPAQLTSPRAARGQGSFLVGFVLLLGVLSLLFAWFADALAMRFGTVLTAVIAVTFWIVFWFVLTWIGSVHRWAMVLVVLSAGSAAWFAASGPFNEAQVRTSAVPAAASGTLDDDLRAWLQARQTQIRAAATPYPVFIAAAEGGGIRAGYWAAALLTAISERNAAFAPHLLAVSGVSGGSVGAGVYAAVQAAAEGNPVPLPCARDNSLSPCVRAVLGADLLAAPLGSMLLHEPWFSLRDRADRSDRTVQLERALETAFERATGQALLQQAFAGSWPAAGTQRVPLVLSNATVASSAQRAVFASKPLPGGWGDALDLAALPAAARVPFSSALFVSARFPGISTTGSLPALNGSQQTLLRLVDGGYADNSGAASAAVLVQRVVAIAKEMGLRVQPVVLVMRNAGPEQTEAGTETGTGTLGRGVWGTLIDPVQTLDGVRAGNSKLHVEQLRSTLQTLNGEMIDAFRLEHGAERFPLGWTLGANTIKRMDDRIAELLQQGSGVQRLDMLMSAQ